MILSLRRYWNAARLPLLAVALASIVVAAHEAPSRRLTPRSAGELVDRLRQSGVHFWVVPVLQSGLDLDAGVFLCARDRSWEELSRLHRAAEYQAEWAGAVLAQQWPAYEGSIDFIRREWQGCSAGVGDLLLFGDPDLLRRIVAAVRR
jgi:hypothetical protein